MLPLFIYILKVILVSGILLGYYWIGLRNTRFHYYNRFYLVVTVLLSLVLPLLDLQWFTFSTTESAPVQQVVQFIYQSEGIITEDQSLSWDQILVLALSLVSAILLILFVIGVLKVYLLKSKGKVTVMERFDFIETALDEAPFSFFRNLFWREGLPVHDKTGQRMLKHELTHIEQYHSYDKLFVAFTTYLFWVNPFYWLIRKELEVVHEFIADEEAVAGEDAAALAEMLLKAHYHSNSLSVGQSFFYSSIKRRIIMLTSSKKVSYSYARRLLILPVAMGVLVLLSFTIKESLSDNPNSKMDKAAIAVSKLDSVPAKYRDPKTGQIKGSFQIDIDGEMASFKDIKSKKELFKVPLNELAGPSNKKGLVEGIPLYTEKKITFISYDSMPAGTTFIGTADAVRLRGGTDSAKAPRIIINGKEISPADLDKIDPSIIKTIDIRGDEKGGKKVITVKVDSVFFDGKAKVDVPDKKAMVTVIGKSFVNESVQSNLNEEKAITVVGRPISKSNLNGEKVITVVGRPLPKEMRISADTNYRTIKTNSRELAEIALNNDDLVAVDISEESGKKMYRITTKNTGLKEAPSLSLAILDGKEVSEQEINAITPDKIQSINVLKGEAAIKKYGDKAKNGVVEITTKK